MATWRTAFSSRRRRSDPPLALGGDLLLQLDEADRGLDRGGGRVRKLGPVLDGPPLLARANGPRVGFDVPVDLLVLLGLFGEEIRANVLPLEEELEEGKQGAGRRHCR